MQLTVARYDPEPGSETPTYVDVGFDVVLDDGRRFYSTATVYLAGLTNPDEATIIAAAGATVRPGLTVLEAPSPEEEEPE